MSRQRARGFGAQGHPVGDQGGGVPCDALWLRQDTGSASRKHLPWVGLHVCQPQGEVQASRLDLSSLALAGCPLVPLPLRGLGRSWDSPGCWLHVNTKV
jgi:hypothetical protein